MTAKHRVFRSAYDSWEKMAEEVSAFLTQLGPDSVIGVSHSQESNVGVIIVWYWDPT